MTTATRRWSIFDLPTRSVIGLILLLNGAVIAGAAITHSLPNWPPGQTDIHIADQTGTPIFTFDGADNINPVGPITFWNDISISNSIFTALLVMVVLVLLSFMATARLSEHPGRLQSLFELIVQGLADFMREAGGPGVVRFLPLFGSLFLFALFSNWLSIVPLVGQIELLHSPTADYHTNLGMALTGFVWYQAAGIRENGLAYFNRWLNFTGFKEGPLVGFVMLVFVGPIEFASELFRILTLTLRLWGNIWGGEIVLAVLAALLFVPSLSLPFIGLELFIGFIQAFVFAFLVLLYIILALESHGEEHEEHEDEAHHESLPKAA